MLLQRESCRWQQRSDLTHDPGGQGIAAGSNGSPDRLGNHIHDGDASTRLREALREQIECDLRLSRLQAHRRRSKQCSGPGPSDLTLATLLRKPVHEWRGLGRMATTGSEQRLQ